MGEAEVREAVASALRLVNMQDYMYRATHTLSGGQRLSQVWSLGGQQQRIAIAGACCRLLGAPRDAHSLLSRGMKLTKVFDRVRAFRIPQELGFSCACHCPPRRCLG